MKVGILDLNFGVHGEATAAILWRDGFRSLGHESDIITMSASGKVLAWMRKDCEFRCLPSKKVDYSVSEISKYDILVSFGTGTLGETEGVKPHYTYVLEKLDVPMYSYCPDIAHALFRNFKNTDMFLGLPIVQGLMFSRDPTRKSLVEGYPELVEGKKILQTPHPFAFDREIVSKPEGSIISATALRSRKNVDKLLKAIEQFNLLERIPILIWGSKDRSMYSWRLEENYGETLDKIYLGPYDRFALDDVYEDARFSVDFSATKGDGGIQVSYLEAMSRSVVQIVSPGWNVAGTCIEVPSLKPPDIADAIIKAAGMSESDRLELVSAGFQFLKGNNAPEKVIGNFFGYFGI